MTPKPHSGSNSLLPPRAKQLMTSPLSMAWGILLHVLASAHAEHPIGMPWPLHIFAEFGAYAVLGNDDYQIFDLTRVEGDFSHLDQDENHMMNQAENYHEAMMVAYPFRECGMCPPEVYPDRLTNMGDTFSSCWALLSPHGRPPRDHLLGPYWRRLGRGHHRTSLTLAPEVESDSVWMMQQMGDDAAWVALLEAIRVRLQSMSKVERALILDYMLRRLDWQCTDKASGYLLGHMGGRVASFTSLLVAFKDGVELDSERRVPPEAEGMWSEAAHFLATHPGSRKQRGLPMEAEEPIIMLTNREVPSEFLTPGCTPPQTPTRDAPRRKRQCITVEVSSGSRDDPHVVRMVQPPHVSATTTVHMRVTVHEVDDSDGSATVAADPPTSPTGAVLTPPAPGSLANMGVSLFELWRLQQGWKEGRVTLDDLVRDYGNEAAGLLLRQCQAQGENEGDGQGPDDEAEQDVRTDRVAHTPRPRPDAGEEDGDDSALLSLPGYMYLAVPVVVAGMEEEPTNLELIKEHLSRQRGEGMTSKEQASTIYTMMEARGNREYLNHLPELFEDIGLPVDIDMSVRCLPGPTPFLVWVEAELWDSFIDSFEAQVGHESAALQALRGQMTMPQGDRDSWRRWAGIRPGAVTRSRSRSPRPPRSGAGQRLGPGNTAQRVTEDETENMGGDEVSMMHRATEATHERVGIPGEDEQGELMAANVHVTVEGLDAPGAVGMNESEQGSLKRQGASSHGAARRTDMTGGPWEQPRPVHLPLDIPCVAWGPIWI